MSEAITQLGLLEDEEIDLLPAALELAGLDHPEADFEPSLDLVGEMADEIAMLAGDAGTLRPRAEALCAVIAGDHGFDGDRVTYDDPANADMLAVLERRRGLPVSLSILYADLARQMEWTCHVLNTPGHVLIRLEDGEQGLLLDPFNGGAVIDAAGVDRLLSGMVGRPMVAEPGHFTPMTNRETLVRLLQNPASRAEAGGDVERAIVLYSRMMAVAPRMVQGWWHHARLSAALGRKDQARTSLGALLEITRDAGLRRQIVTMMERLAQG